MEKNLRDVIIFNLAQKYGKSFVKPEDDGIIIRHVGLKNGRIIYHIPAALLPDHDTADFVDPIEGYYIPELLDKIWPSARIIAEGNAKISFLSSYNFAYDTTIKDRVINVHLCQPSGARYLLIKVPTYSLTSPHTEYIGSGDNRIIWVSHRNKGPCYIHFKLFKLGAITTKMQQSDDEMTYYAPQFRQIATACIAGKTPPELAPYDRNAQAQTAPASGQPTEPAYDYGHDAKYVDGQLQYHSFRFLDEISGEQSWVITTEGYLLRPSEVTDHSKVIYGDIAAFEVWQNLPPNCLIIHWRREGISQPHQCSIVYQTPNPTAQQIRRVRAIEAKIYHAWQDRRDPFTQRLIDNANCTWNLTGGES